MSVPGRKQLARPLRGSRRHCKQSRATLSDGDRKTEMSKRRGHRTDLLSGGKDEPRSLIRPRDHPEMPGETSALPDGPERPRDAGNISVGCLVIALISVLINVVTTSSFV